MKRIIPLALMALAACGPPTPADVDIEIMESSAGVVGKIVLLKTSPSLKQTSLDDAAKIWETAGWRKGKSEDCKDAPLPQNTLPRAFEFGLLGVVDKNIPTVDLRLCATQLANPKRIAAIGYIVSSHKAAPYKP
jgi:hypothetical protein